jgi:diacylglycerol kinase (ATP)
MGKPGATGIRRVINAFGYSLQGIRAALQHESAFRQEVAMFFIMLPVAWWLGRTYIEWALLVGSMFVVLIVELLNSAIEAVVDRVSDDHSELAGRAKDMGSAAVLVSLLNVSFIWVMVAWHRFLA